MHHCVAIFGEAEKGSFSTPLFIDSVEKLNQSLGIASRNSCGLFFAIQFLSYHYPLIYLRVREEGFNPKDYFDGMKQLLSKSQKRKISAVSLPGVGDVEIINAILTMCKKCRSILLTTEKDFYDYITTR